MPDKKENFCYAPMQKNYMMEAEKLLPEKKETYFTRGKEPCLRRCNICGFIENCPIYSYNQSKDEDIKIVANLLRQVAELKKDNLALATRRLRVVEEKFEDKK